MLSIVKNVIGPSQLDIWIDTIGLTSIKKNNKNTRKIKIPENVPRIHPSEVNDILKE